MKFRWVGYLFFLVGLLVAGGKTEGELSRVAFIAQTLANPFFVTMASGVRDSAREINPEVKVTSLSSDNDLQKQTEQIDNLVAGGVDLIILNSVDGKGIGPAVNRARQAGVVVIAADVGAANAEATIQSDNWQAGRLAGEFIAQHLPGQQGSIVILTGDPVSAVIGRVGGVKEVLAKYPGIQILSDTQNAKGQRDQSYEVMTGLLTAFPNIDAVFAINDPSAIGAELAIKQANRTDVQFVVGVDGSPDAVTALKREGSLLAASPAQDPYRMAYDAVKMGYGIIQGTPPAQKEVLIPTTLITKDNVADYKGWVVVE